MGVQTQEVSTHYSSSLEYFNDQFMILDLLIEEIIHQGKQMDSNPISLSNKLTLSDDEALSILRDKLTFLQLSEPYQKLIARLELIISQKLDKTSKSNEELVTLLRFLQTFHLDELDKRVLIILLAPHINKKYLRLYGYIQNDMTKQFVTLELLVKLSARSFADIRLLYDRYSKLDSHFSLLYKLGDKQQVLFYDSSLLVRPIQPNEQLVQYLLKGENYKTLHSSYYHFYHLTMLQTNLEPLLTQQQLTNKMAEFTNKTAHYKPIFHLVGPIGAGKTLHTKHLAVQLRQSLLEVNIAATSSDKESFFDQINETLLVALLTKSILTLTQIESDQIQDKLKLDWLQVILKSFEGLICLHTYSNKSLSISMERPITSIQLDLPLPSESTYLWREYSTQYCELSEQEANQLANKFQFTCGQIKQTMIHAEQKLLWDSLVNQQLTHDLKIKSIIESAYTTIHHDLDKKTIKLDSTWEWKDLILPDETVALLQQACDRVANRQRVMEEWGFSRLLPYGRGISMLFTGPPGTGKSMSASVMAKQMKSELYRVDLSSVVSKYIGETEKNLAEIFDEAKMSGAILFFDEADSLFGKRSEVKDSHDKYANMETSFLLQKMEEYEGLTILATNFAQNMDDAFNRRIQYIVKFPFPDSQQRERLWKSVIPPQLPVEDIDFPFLAKTFELTGGPIKNIVLTAAYLAAYEQKEVSMQFMVEAAIQEYKKSGKLLMKDKLGIYSHFWKG